VSPRLRPGQTPKPPGRKRLAEDVGHLHIRVPAESLAEWTAAAAAAGETLSGWVRARLDRAARRSS
jgi:hypothetical protein